LNKNEVLGWSPELKKERPNSTAMNYYAYWLNFPNEDYFLLNWSGQLFQQYCVDHYVKIETERFLYISLNQSDFCVDQFYGVVETYQNGPEMGNETGIISPQ
jgi:hypothetical protein